MCLRKFCIPYFCLLFILFRWHVIIYNICTYQHHYKWLDSWHDFFQILNFQFYQKKKANKKHDKNIEKVTFWYVFKPDLEPELWNFIPAQTNFEGEYKNHHMVGWLICVIEWVDIDQLQWNLVHIIIIKQRCSVLPFFCCHVENIVPFG